MDNQSWGWFANIDDDSFVDFQVEERSQKFTQQEELSEKFPQQPCSWIIQFIGTPFYYILYFKYAIHLAQIHT